MFTDSVPRSDSLLLRGYEHVVESGNWDEQWLSQSTNAPVESLAEVHRTLISLKVIERDTASEGGWKAVSPHVAMARLVVPIEAEAQRQVTRADDLRRRFQELLPVYEARQESKLLHTVEVVDQRALTDLIENELARCREELLVMRLATERATAEQESYLRAHRNGVKVRMLYQHAARYRHCAEGFIEQFSRLDRVEFRTAQELPAELLIFDNAKCLLVAAAEAHDGSATSHRTDADTTAVVLRHPALVPILVSVFEEAWARGTSYTPDDEVPGWVGDELRRSILRLLATGAKDEAVARRLGISTRTCRRHISELMSTLDAASRFHAGVEAGRRRLV